MVLDSMINTIMPPGGLARHIAAIARELLCRPIKTMHLLHTDEKMSADMQFEKENRYLLMCDIFSPDPKIGAGHPRAYQIVSMLMAAGWKVVLWTVRSDIASEEIKTELSNKGAVIISWQEKLRRPVFSRFLAKYGNHFQVVFISRSLIMKDYYPLIKKYCSNSKIIYDAEAIAALREIRFLDLVKPHYLSEKRKKQIILDEINLARPAHAVIAVSENERKHFADFGISKTYVVGHTVMIQPTMNTFVNRRNVLFVGSVYDTPSPNEDAVIFFCSAILPIIQKNIDLSFTIAGANNSAVISSFDSPCVNQTGAIEDLRPLYNTHKIFVAPTRYSAGIPLKVYEAAAQGIPCVVTPLLAEQLGWSDGVECLVGDGAEEFAKKCCEIYTNEKLWESIREHALDRVKKDCNQDRFRENLLAAIG